MHGQVSTRYLTYVSHSGFGNQIRSLRKAMMLAYLDGRTLVVPPLLDHGAIALGDSKICEEIQSNPALKGAIQDKMSSQPMRVSRYAKMHVRIYGPCTMVSRGPNQAWLGQTKEYGNTVASAS